MDSGMDAERQASWDAENTPLDGSCGGFRKLAGASALFCTYNDFGAESMRAQNQFRLYL